MSILNRILTDTNAAAVSILNRILTDTNLADVVGGWSQFLSVLVTIGAIVIARQQLIATREQIQQSEKAMLEQLKQAEEQQKLTQQQLEQIRRAEMPEALIFFDYSTVDSLHIDVFNIKKVPVYIKDFHVEGEVYGKRYFVDSSKGVFRQWFETSHPLDRKPIILNQGDRFRVTIDRESFFETALGPEEIRKTGSANAVLRFDTPFIWEKLFLEIKVDIERPSREFERQGYEYIAYYYSYSTDGKVYHDMFDLLGEVEVKEPEDSSPKSEET